MIRKILLYILVYSVFAGAVSAYGKVYAADKEQNIRLFLNGEEIGFTYRKRDGKIFAEVKELSEIIGAEFKRTDNGCVIEKGIHRLSLNKDKIFADCNDVMAITDAPFEENGKIYAEITEVCGLMGANAVFDGENSIYIMAEENGYLVNTVKAIRERNEVRIGFSGGAAAFGKGAGDSNSSYRKLLMTKLKDYCGAVRVTELNNTIGETGSDLELFRIDSLLLQKPDVLFVDFCSEDSGHTYDDEVKYLERLILEVKGCSADTDIVILGTWNDKFEAAYEDNESSDVVKTCEYIANKYHAAFIDIGKSLYSTAAESGKNVSDNYMRYRHYPNDAGHAFYAEEIFGFFKESLQSSSEPSLYTKPSVELPEKTVRGYMQSADNISSSGFKKKTMRVGGSACEVLTGTVGAELTLEFNGCEAGIMWITGIDTGEIEYSIGGGKKYTKTAFDDLGVREYRKSYSILAEGLEDKEHILKIRVTDNHAAMSLGNKIMITDFFVGVTAEPSWAEVGFEADIEDIPPQSVSAGKDLSSCFTIKNNTSKPERFMAVTACYNKENALIDCDAQIKTADCGGRTEFKNVIRGIKSETKMIKQMLWRCINQGAYIPVCPAKTVNVSFEEE